jgi:translation elongation factor EF-1beta
VPDDCILLTERNIKLYLRGETFKLEPVAFGIKKLVMTCTIVDALGKYF